MNLSEHILNELNKVKINYIQPKYTILKEIKTDFNTTQNIQEEINQKF